MSRQHSHDVVASPPDKSPEEWVLEQLHADTNGGMPLRKILDKAEGCGYERRVARNALRDSERAGKVRVDWDWKYHPVRHR